MEIKEKILGVINAQIGDISEKLVEAKLLFADTNLNENEWHNRGDKKIDCKVYQGQIEILESMGAAIEDLLSSKALVAIT